MNELIERLHCKNIKITEIPHWGIYFRKRWDDYFVNHLQQDEKEKIYLYGDRYICGYLWHVFSYERRPHLSKNEANKAFDAVMKSSCYIFYQHSSDVLFVERAAALKAADFATEEDVYIVDQDFTWTYIVTHESYCGPYFSNKSSLIIET